MNAALLSLALLGSHPLIPISDNVPVLKVEALCKDTTATDKAMGLVLAQSYDGCMSDETAARQKLTAVWQANPGAVRDRCEGEAVAGGSQSYVDLLTCIQMADPGSQATPLRGASKTRNAK